MRLIMFVFRGVYLFRYVYVSFDMYFFMSVVTDFVSSLVRYLCMSLII